MKTCLITDMNGIEQLLTRFFLIQYISPTENSTKTSQIIQVLRELDKVIYKVSYQIPYD